MIDEYLQKPYWIIDILPCQVPAGSPGRYFTVQEYYLREPQLTEIKKKHLHVLLKLNCYRDISIDETDQINPSPDYLEEEIRKRYLCIKVDDAMILTEPDDTHMTVFNPDQELLELIKAVSAGEGLYVWKP